MELLIIETAIIFPKKIFDQFLMMNNQDIFHIKREIELYVFAN